MVIIKKQNGFSAIEGLLLLIITGILGFTGWYVWHGKNNANKSYSNSESAGATSLNNGCKAMDLSQYCIERAPANKTKFSKLPNDLQQIVVAHEKDIAPQCVKNGKLVDSLTQKYIDPDVKYSPIGSALVGVGCGHSEGLFATNVKSGEWRFVEATQFGFDCKSIFSNPVPRKLLEFGQKAECLGTNNKFIPYDTASSQYFL